jgi:hypothetical protein
MSVCVDWQVVLLASAGKMFVSYRVGSKVGRQEPSLALLPEMFVFEQENENFFF